MPGRSAAPSHTVDLMIESCASLVGWCSTRGMPRIISGLAPDAECGAAAVDRMRRDEPRSTTMTRKSTATVSGELVDERAAVSTRVAVVAEARTARFDRFRQHRDYRIAKQRGLAR